MTHENKSGIRPTTGDSRWFTHARFGLYIHWGLYSMPARHEWVKARERMADAEYDRYFRHFEPTCTTRISGPMRPRMQE